jgi:hypothetical protein
MTAQPRPVTLFSHSSSAAPDDASRHGRHYRRPARRMTIPFGGPFNHAGDNARVGVQGQYVTIEGDVKVTATADESPDAKYKAGKANLNSRNPEQTRELIWDAMMGWEAIGDRQVTSEVLFHWLMAMLSGRTVRQFTRTEIDQLQHFRSSCTENGGDDWTRGVRLIYQLLDSALRPPADEDGPKTSMSLLISQFDSLDKKQRDLLRPLDLFLSGPRKDEMWRDQLGSAQAGQCSVDRQTHPRPSRRMFRSDPAYPAARAAGSSRFAEIRPLVLSARLRAGHSLAATGCRVLGQALAGGILPPELPRALAPGWARIAEHS